MLPGHLGQTKTGTFRYVHLPLSKAAMTAAGLLVFVDCVKELPATLLLRPLNVETFATHLYGEAARGTYEEAAIAALAIVAIGILPVILLARLGRVNKPSDARPCLHGMVGAVARQHCRQHPERHGDHHQVLGQAKQSRAVRCCHHRHRRI